MSTQVERLNIGLGRKGAMNENGLLLPVVRIRFSIAQKKISIYNSVQHRAFFYRLLMAIWQYYCYQCLNFIWEYVYS